MSINVPIEGRLFMSISYLNGSADGYYLSGGASTTFSGLFEGKAHPEQSISGFRIDSKFAINNRIGIMLYIPYVLSQSYEYNFQDEAPWYLSDLSGKAAFGDVRFGGWLVLKEASKYRLTALGEYKLATGSSPDEITIENIYLTGTGQTSITLGLTGNFDILPRLILSAGGFYVLNNEGGYSRDGFSWKEKPGNQVILQGRGLINITGYLSAGYDFQYFYQGNSSVNGKKTRNTESRLYSLTPLISCQAGLGNSVIKIFGGYHLPFDGENTLKFKTFEIGTEIFL